MKYLFALMNDETRCWIAQEVADTTFKCNALNLFHEGKEIAGKKPNTLVNYGLPAYHDDVFNTEFYGNKKQQSHVKAINLNGDTNNNKMERINGEIKSTDTSIIAGSQIFHNFMRPYEALKGKTPAEACEIGRGIISG